MFTKTNNTMLVNEVMLDQSHIPVIKEAVIFKEALEEMGQAKLGIVCVINDENNLLGILTDGDIRRKLLKVQKPFSAFFVDDALDHAILAPLTINPNETLIKAINIMEQKKIWDLPVVDNKDKLVGLLHLHPAVKALLGGSK
ncbi:CBS domain-containing protein [Alphaproteobacteria bacterium]|nr:CBS domain-containing protein [Alphaproteobacteria bacterium]